ncbi:ABC transporter permease subunit [Halobacillus karajensis]|uniref:ABC-type antimicrobial peptide transport system, permease component n=1 Tax=Halobacillus karajensis TaxID=195088 RepID=A0A024PAB0_9BACI|nr:ABC transporter permease subunit [Halobacillus karajensis]CDQ21259.1 ABC-type antimicrobial peptide transport system, permease component [Halobacillus karajensis]CDQ25671.1 ABC-type antimicrobial peptide transport system, permease component [Halobacillus karajensis]CDQ25942.1 ABC-type antimicrobial peptide transport system, permease component [Halobacillus karajensis]
MRIFNIIFNYLLGVIGIILISSVPALFNNNFQWNISNYLGSVWSVIQTLFTPSEWFFHYRHNYLIVEKPLFSYIFDNYFYSMTILFSALTIALIVGMILALSTFGLPQKWKRAIHTILNSLEALPDILFIFFLQMFVVWFYNSFNILLFKFAYLGEGKIYLSPVLSLSILPTILFFRTFLLLLEEEWGKDYVVLARSKGFGKTYILIRHCLRNIKVNLIIQSKPILWFTLSSLLVVEYLHNIYGIVHLIFFDTRPFIITVALLLIFTPFYILYFLLDWVLKTDLKEISKQIPITMMKNAKVFDTHRWPQVNFSLWVKLWREWLQLLKNPKFLMGMGYITGILGVSIIYSFIYDLPVESIGIFQDEDGNYHAPPHPPGEGQLIFGSNLNGYPIMTMLVLGAKYTILVTMFIALVRVGLGYLLTISYVFWLGKRSKKVISELANGMQFLPLTLVGYLLLVDVVIFEEDQRILAESLIVPNMILEVVILIVFAIPVLLNTLGKESDEMLKKEFIQSAMLLGASRSRIFFKHITLHLLPKVTLLLGQQMIQVLQVLLHLGVLSIFLGGTIRGNREGASQSLLYDWTSLFETMRVGVMTERYWLIVPVLVLYILLILSIQAIMKSLIDHQQRKIGIYSTKKRNPSVNSMQGVNSCKNKEMFTLPPKKYG